MTEPGDRRPIAARDWRPIQDAAAWLIRRRASPNAISVAGMVAAIVGGILFALTPGAAQPWALWLGGAVLVQLRLLANVLDGMVAVGRGVASPVGELYNEVPDRISDTAVLTGIGYAALDPALGWAAATAAMLTAYVRTTGRAAGAPSDFRGPMAKQQRMALVTALAVFCAVAPAGWLIPAAPAVLWVVSAGAALTALRRLAGIARALRGMIGQMYGPRVTLGIVAAVCAVMLIATAAIFVLSRTGRVRDPLRRELWLRLRSWAIILPVMLGPVLLGRVWLIGAVTLLGVLCLREYDRATGLFREPVMAAGVVTGILLINFAALDHWYGFFTALFPLTVVGLAVISLPLDRPAGYIQRTGLAVFAFLLFGAGLAHLGFMGNDPGYRPLVLLLLTAVAINDVFAFTAGKLLGGRKLLPATSPNKTVSGALGALLCTAPLVALIAWPIFRATPLDRWYLLLGLGAIVSLAGQAGDLMLSSIKRDLGIKDMGVVIPGHGGLLDRFNSLLLVAPATFHYVNYYVGFGPSG